MPVFFLIETHAATWALCNAQWAHGRADDDDVAALVTAASELEHAKPQSMDEFVSKWRALAAYWRQFEEEIGADEIEKMLGELAEVERCTRPACS
jgi:hypothetical protein